ncbi:long-chain-fatty-acid--CoA ligase [Paenochrobactrum pullorum]|uniref:long-chain-fatty-acid--CoA ligase n=1 Tax=Paenochrobactrum pullorum TaxID=1324351 RepID=UPI0035BC9644
MTADNALEHAPDPHRSVSNSSTTEKIWLKSYAPEVPETIPSPVFNSISAMITDACKRFDDRPAFTCMDKSLTYRALHEQSGWLAAWLSAKGLVKGDRVAVMMPNILQYPLSIAAILRAGLVVVNINPLYTPRELAQQLNDAGAKAIIILENFASTLEKALPEIKIADIQKPHILVASMGDMHGLKGHLINLVVRRIKKLVPRWHLPHYTRFKAALKIGRAHAVPMPVLKRSDLAFLQYTGGTTGASKGAMLSHGNILANLDQMRLWLDVAYRIKGKPDDVNYICALPLYHVFALTVNAMIGIQQGARNILIPNPRDIKSFVKELQKYPFHIFPALNTLFNALMNNPDFKNLNFKPLILTLGGGMAVQKPVAERWQQMTGCLITEGYGLSETSPVVAANGLDATQFTGTIGLPMPSTDIAILDDDGNYLPLGEVGEICVRGPQLMLGYWQRDDDTACSFTKDGFFRTGDLGFMDENGYTKIVDRKKDMILVSGFNVYPNELEEVLVAHDSIKEAAAIGVPDAISGEVVKLFIVRKDPNLSEEEVKAYCAERLTNYKRPRMIEFRDELPKSNVGKILRRKLRDANLSK